MFLPAGQVAHAGRVCFRTTTRRASVHPRIQSLRLGIRAIVCVVGRRSHAPTPPESPRSAEFLVFTPSALSPLSRRGEGNRSLQAVSTRAKALVNLSRLATRPLEDVCPTLMVT